VGKDQERASKIISSIHTFYMRTIILLFFSMYVGAHILMSTVHADNNYQVERHKMVKDQIEARGVKNPRVLNALREIPRHEFIIGSRLEEAYADYPLSIGYGQTISQPYIVGFMTELLHVDAESVVLEIGTGSGYQAAVLAAIAKQVYTIEIIPELATRAQATLQRLGYENITVRAGDGYIGWEEHAPFDAIIITAAAPEIPQPLFSQLKKGGRMVLPVNAGVGYQMLKVVTKNEQGDLRAVDTIPVRFVPFVRSPEGE